jgi:hypothetical protein
MGPALWNNLNNFKFPIDRDSTGAGVRMTGLQKSGLSEVYLPTAAPKAYKSRQRRINAPLIDGEGRDQHLRLFVKNVFLKYKSNLTASKYTNK